MSIDNSFKYLENNYLFCIKAKENRVCTGNCYYGLGTSDIFYCSRVLSISINELVNEKYSNPLNILLDIYFPDIKRICNDTRCKNGIIVHTIKTFYDNFEFPLFLIFVIDSLDVNKLKKLYSNKTII